MQIVDSPGHAIVDSYPPTPTQLGMLLHDADGRAAAPYIQQLVCSPPLDWDFASFRAAWRRLVDRHDALRTGFRLGGHDGPRQEVSRRVDRDIDVRDWRHASHDEGRLRLEAFLDDDRRRGFDLDRPPAWRLALVRLPGSVDRLVWTSHHAILDGRSRLILLQELLHLYEGLRRGEVPTLPPVRRFADHARWLAAHDFTTSESYWRDLLAGHGETSGLPESSADPGPDDREPRHRKLEFRLTADQSITLRNAAADIQVTPNTMLQGAWALVLSLYAGLDDVVFVATRACRHSSVEGAESIVGLLINTLPMRAAGAIGDRGGLAAGAPRAVGGHAGPRAHPPRDGASMERETWGWAAVREHRRIREFPA